MSRRRWVYTAGGEPIPGGPVEVDLEWRNATDVSRRSEAEIYGHLQAGDGTPLDSRRKHRDYMKSHGVALADDYRETWAKAAEERRQRWNGGTQDMQRERVEDVARAMQQIENQPRRR